MPSNTNGEVFIIRKEGQLFLARQLRMARQINLSTEFLKDSTIKNDNAEQSNVFKSAFLSVKV